MFPYEIHITVAPNSDVGLFKRIATDLDVKPLELINVVGDQQIPDYMTSSKIFGTYEDAFSCMRNISSELAIAGLSVVREKIETVPWHTDAPSASNGLRMRSGQYFESHMTFLVDEESYDEIKAIAKLHNAFVSQNINKRYDNGLFAVMVTVRNTDGNYETAKIALRSIKADLTKFEQDNNVETEFAIYDSNISHDDIWTNG